MIQAPLRGSASKGLEASEICWVILKNDGKFTNGKITINFTAKRSFKHAIRHRPSIRIHKQRSSEIFKKSGAGQEDAARHFRGAAAFLLVILCISQGHLSGDEFYWLLRSLADSLAAQAKHRVFEQGTQWV